MEPIEQNYIPISLDQRTYRFFPTAKQQKTKFQKGGTRMFYYGQIQHDEYEKRKLKQLHEYAAKHKESEFLAKYSQQRILLFLNGNGYKPQKCIAALKHHQDFLNKYIPAKLTPQTEQILSSGINYTTGRDFNFRPIVVFNAKKIDVKKIDAILTALIYAQQQIIKNCFIPGQVENQITIYDLGGLGLSEIPMGTLKHVLGTLSQNYGGRLFKLFMLNAPSSVWFSWKIVSAFLDPVTVEKITINKNSTDEKIFKYCKPSQIQKKYGGTQPDRTTFFPMTYPKDPNDFFDESRLISSQEYEKMLKSGKLTRNTIDPKYATKEQKKQQ